jgi:hypothetical protein
MEENDLFHIPTALTLLLSCFGVGGTETTTDEAMYEC